MISAYYDSFRKNLHINQFQIKRIRKTIEDRFPRLGFEYPDPLSTFA